MSRVLMILVLLWLTGLVIACFSAIAYVQQDVVRAWLLLGIGGTISLSAAWKIQRRLFK